MIRYLYILLGLISLTLGFLFAKSSPRLHQKLLDNKLTGKYIRRVNNGFSLKGLAISIGIMWCMICFTAFVIFDYGTMRFVMLGLGVAGTISQIIVLGKKRKKQKNESILIPVESEEIALNESKVKREIQKS